VALEVCTTLAALAARNGMTVAEWKAYTDRLEAQEKSRRSIDKTMRSIPRYRDAA
jgi:hypothetical protein